MSVAERHACTLDRVDAACVASGGVAPDFLRALSRRLMPAIDEAWPSHWRSAAWVGVAVKGDAIQIKPYFNLNRGPARERWLRIGWLLKDLGREAALEQLCALSSRCSHDSWPVGLAVDVNRRGGAGRIKVYFRSAAVTPAWLTRWYDALALDVHAASLGRLLDLLGRTGGDRYPASAFVVSLEIHADEAISLKTDVAVTKWMTSDAQIVEGCSALAGSLELQPERLTEALRIIGAWPPHRTTCAELRFVGLGCEPDGSQHINVYVAPPLRANRGATQRRRGTTESTMRDAVKRGLRFLAASHRGGYWQDFSLPVGASDAWVTAYVLASLGELPPGLLEPDMGSIGEALDWLSARRSAGGGWGYHRDVPDDADSTSWAILALRAWRRPVPRDALKLVDSCRRADGGVATYPAETSPAPGWSRAVPDVTAVALRAISPRSRITAPACFAHWQSADGLIPAYWWASPLYTRAMLLDCSPSLQPPTAKFRQSLVAFQPAGSFERALLLRCRLKLSLPGDALARELMEAQNADGGWTPSALLRLTRPEIVQPWTAVDSGPLFLDGCGIFTTATVIASLGRMLHQA
jgi:hypothetical protein